MTDAPALTLKRTGALGWLEVSNGERMNALNSDMWRRVPEILSEVEEDDDIRVLILRGSGTRAFSAGADISEFETARSGDSAKTYDALNHNAFLALTHMRKPTIAMIHGFCLGGGFVLAACCDLRIADTNAQFSIPAAKLGIGYNPRWVTPILALTSPANVKKILFSGQRVKADEALRMGLINGVHAPDALASETETLANAIAQNAPLSVTASKFMVNELIHHPENPDLYKLDKAVQRCFDSEDYAEGRRAFLEKRKPNFQGR